MGILLFLIGILAVGSGAAKLTARSRDRFGVAPMALVEVVVGAIVILGSGAGLARLRPLAWTAVAAVVMAIGVSTVVHMRRALREQARRAASEESRLRQYLGLPLR
jgi:ABC-type siderophore export system fused ATPase/permease subunit